MRYLKDRSQFLSRKVQFDTTKSANYYSDSKLIRETYENDATWGGSLLGRLINSTIRVSKIWYNRGQIGGLVNEVKKQMDLLVAESTTNDVQMKVIKDTKIKLLLEELYKIVTGDEDVDTKLTQLMGPDKNSDTQGILNELISSIEKSEIDEFDPLNDKLKAFRESLKEFDYDPKGEDDEKDDEDDEDEDDEDEGKDGKGGKSGSGSGSGDGDKDPMFTFYTSTMKLFMSLSGLNTYLKNKRVGTQVKLEVGKVYKVTNPQTKKTSQVKVISLSDEKEIGSDRKWLTNDDGTVRPLGQDDAFVIYADNKGQFTSNSTRDVVRKSDILESLFYENESLPIFENVETIRNEETHAKSAWKKITIAAKNADLEKIISQTKEIIEESKSGEKLNKKVVIAIGKQIIENEATSGKPISFEELIKEEYGVIPTKYSDLARRISILSKVIIALKEDMSLIGSFGEASKSIKSFIESYTVMKNAYPKLPSKESQEKRETKDKDKGKDTDKDKDKDGDKNESSYNIYDYKKFRLFEKIDKTKDEVVEAWFELFEEGEEKKWAINTTKVKKVQKDLDNIVSKPFVISTKGGLDRIMRILNTFGRAYKCYATSVIPSGRPNGRVSQKTFREYIYLGGESSSSGGTWDYNEGPSGGPWASKRVFNSWERGITKLLEDKKYRSILANAYFLPRDVKPLGSGESPGNRDDNAAVEKAVRAGRTLLDMINDLLAGEDFIKTRKKVIKEYFSGVDKIEAGTKQELEKPSEIPVHPRDKGESKTVSFTDWSDGGMKRPKSFKSIDNLKTDWKGEFFRGKYKDGNEDKYIIGYFFGIRDGYLVLKFQFSKSGKYQDVITTYLKDQLEDKGWELADGIKGATQDKKLYVGLIKLQEYPKFGLKVDFKMKYTEITGRNKYDSTKINEKELDFSKFEGLARFEESKWETLKAENPKTLMKNDIEKIEKINVRDF